MSLPIRGQGDFAFFPRKAAGFFRYDLHALRQRRSIVGFQGGCPEGTGMGGPGYRIKGEFNANGVKNDLKHTYGVLSMARSMMKDSAGSQFFIMTSDSPHLDGQYAAFGRVLEGMEEAEKIVSQRTDRMDRPLEPQRIQSIRVETNGVEYPFTKL